jgi:hypothetical protein
VVDWSEIKAIAGSRRHDISNATQGGSRERQSNHDEQVKQWRQALENEDAIRKEAGLKIDPKTAKVVWTYALRRDPYGKHQVVREYFARSPGSRAWVNFHDLPEATRDALWKKHRRKLAFPPGLEALLTAEARRAFDE